MKLLFWRDILITNRYTNTIRTYQSIKRKIKEVEK
jgi:hypothetical protein